MGIAKSGTIVAQFTSGAERISAPKVVVAILAAVPAESHSIFFTIRAGAYDAVPAGTVLGFAFAASLADVRAILAYAAVYAP